MFAPPRPLCLVVPLLVGALLLGPPPLDAAPDALRGCSDAHVAAALEAAGDNRAELERVLTHYRSAGDEERLAAARFLVANMPGHGYIVTALRRTSDGKVIPYDPLAFPDFKASLAALDALEAEHGTLEFDRARKVEDVRVIKADYLIRHIDASVAAWRATPEAQRVSFAAFLDFVLPYRGSQEPLEDWLTPLQERYSDLRAEVGTSAEVLGELRKRINKDIRTRLRFNERFYLHPTDQGFSEMQKSGQGRCEDITNMQTYAARAMSLATAADYTPYWAHRDNNHAWNVLLDKQGRGFHKGNAHAAKVYRKTFRIQRDSLPFHLPAGREAPNRFMASRFAVDVTDQYRTTTDVHVALDTRIAGHEQHAYLCVFNGGDWKAIHWSPIHNGRASFDRMGRNICYLPAIHDGTRLVPAAAPRIVRADGSVETLSGLGPPRDLHLLAVSPKKVSPDTFEETPVSWLKEGTTYRLSRWTPNGWVQERVVEASKDPMQIRNLSTNTLYWAVADGSRKLERIFTIDARGFQRWW